MFPLNHSTWFRFLPRVRSFMIYLLICIAQKPEHLVPTEPRVSQSGGDSQFSLSFMKLPAKWKPGCLETRYPYIFRLPRIFVGRQLKSWKSIAWGWLFLPVQIDWEVVKQVPKYVGCIQPWSFLDILLSWWNGTNAVRECIH